MSQQDHHPTTTVADWLAELVAALGATAAAGITGREITALWLALMARLPTHHARHELGAMFSAIGKARASGKPAVTYSTTGPGLANAAPGFEAARAAGIKLVHFSPLTPAAERGRGGIQETGPSGYGNDDLHRAGRVFDHVTLLESPAQLPQIAAQLAAGLAGPGPFLAHIAVPVDVQRMAAGAIPFTVPEHQRPAPAVAPDVAGALAERMVREPFFVWVGDGASGATRQVRALLDRTGAPVIGTPRSLGIADRHPQFLGTSGNGGDPGLTARLAEYGPAFALVLGTGLREASSGWVDELVPPGGLVHVDLDPAVFGRAYPLAPTLGIQADVARTLDALLARRLVRRTPYECPNRATRLEGTPSSGPGLVHPEALMAAIQRVVVDGSDAHVVADASSSMFLAARHLRFDEPGRFHIEPHFGAMGFAGAAALGVASASGVPAVALTGDAALLMQCEIGTAVGYGIPVVWVVLNDGGLGIVRHGMERHGLDTRETEFPPTDFAAIARAKGAAGERVTSAAGLYRTLHKALGAGRPFLIDVAIDPSVPPPLGLRGAR